MIVLGRIKASTIVHFTALLGLGTISLCYVLAASLKHVKPWLPMISDCAVLPPEEFPFRFGVLTTALLMAGESLIIYLAAVPKSKVALGLGVVASLCLGVVGVVNEEEASKLHSSK